MAPLHSATGAPRFGRLNAHQSARRQQPLATERAPVSRGEARRSASEGDPQESSSRGARDGPRFGMARRRSTGGILEYLEDAEPRTRPMMGSYRVPQQD